MIGIVGLGGILGTLLRYYLGQWISSQTAPRGSQFPWGTWVINLSGSLLLGVLAGLHTRQAIPDWGWLMLGTGFCGAYTTFSTFGYETITLINKGQKQKAAVYVLTSALLGAACAWLGSWLVST
ncbi:fluoride efflux transporter CrcB [Paenibacillus phoenicis]|uniref:Fluoride-specific ion channel FluC n=1 Tax=Paenibacillus phoenicis TaxID=554117 RepID=A0ABU5PHP8_9BACL|nr:MULTISPECIES: fluoride efflux transporter CrcB [Paenibacillus]EES75236.1 protein CrcB [Paenibacillus sp. oral taxon 786 str. D14]MCT2193952.1 fluoride efflux transporter CrcB [Paenibacillus sp. p3-SID1389]MEA3569444.1 fluoride efflux transporter CrcB [Paenibacillus phoenicis]